MNQSKIVKEVTLEKIVAQAESIISRDLTEMEQVLIDYALEQIRLGLVK